MKKYFCVAGTRPNIIKIDPTFPQVICFTGQHHEKLMKDVFLKGIKIPKPDYELDETSLGGMINGIMSKMILENPDYAIVIGDCRSSVAGAIAAQQLNIPIIHFEAGCRSGNFKMIEERNRILIDKMAMIHFCPSQQCVVNLFNEGISQYVFNVGAIQFSNLKKMLPTRNTIKESYYLLTLHRAENVDCKETLQSIFKGLKMSGEKIILPIHPRLRDRLKGFDLKVPENVHIIEPLSYKSFIHLLGFAKKVITDSGGVQPEAYWMRTPCITLRNETEWQETVNEGWNKLVGTDPVKIADAIKNWTCLKTHHSSEAYGRGEAHKYIRNLLLQL